MEQNGEVLAIQSAFFPSMIVLQQCQDIGTGPGYDIYLTLCLVYSSSDFPAANIVTQGCEGADTEMSNHQEAHDEALLQLEKSGVCKINVNIVWNFHMVSNTGNQQ